MATSCGHSLPSPVTSVTNYKTITYIVSSGEEEPMTPHEQLYANDMLQRIRLSIERDINRSTIAPLFQGILNFDPLLNTSRDPLEYCQEHIKAVMKGSNIKTDSGGCQFQVNCNYKLDRFPSFIFQGKCLKSYCSHSQLKKPCRIYRERISILLYKRRPFPSQYTSVGGGGGEGEFQTSGMWTRSSQSFNSDCSCSIEQ